MRLKMLHGRNICWKDIMFERKNIAVPFYIYAFRYFRYQMFKYMYGYIFVEKNSVLRIIENKNIFIIYIFLQIIIPIRFFLYLL